MGAYDNESTILADVESVQDPEVCFLPEPTDGAVAFLAAVRDVPSWTKSERPDLYSGEHQLAIEVMRVDDHPKVGRVKNPTLARESEIERSIRSAFPALNPGVPVIVVASTGLPSVEDHNFTAYRYAFARIVGNHAKKVATYRQNHLGYTLAFLVHDESSAYVEAEQPSDLATSDGSKLLGRPHYWFLDADFTEIIAGSGVDFFFWHAPFKHIWYLDAFGRKAKVELPTLAVFDVAAMKNWKDQLKYDIGRLVSVEE